jgi:hypothetical protein
MKDISELERILRFGFGVPFTIIGLKPELIGINGTLQLILLGAGLLMLTSVAFNHNVKNT